jgi:predicted  nucleic acid-binding Zn-ribbon protein
MKDINTMKDPPVVHEGAMLADRVDAKIGSAEHDLEVLRREWDLAALAESRAKEAYVEFRGLTSSIKNLAPLIRDEVSSLERIWHNATEKKLKLKESLEAAHKELASVCRARDQLKQIGCYHPSA